MARVRVEIPVEESQQTVQTQSVGMSSEGEGQPIQPQKSSSFPYKKFFAVMVVIVGFIFIANLISDKNKLEQQVKGSQTSNVEEVVKQLSQGVELPVNEVPQMRTIEDAARFTQQNPSLSDIKNGDQLLFFEKSKKVVVYRPSTKKAVVVVTLAEPTDQTTEQNTQ
jgi:hypothetical protein